MPEQAYKRAERVSHLLQKELGDLLVHGITDPRVGFATVTEVRVTDDLRNARVYVSVYGTAEERAQSLEAIQESVGFLRKEIGRRVRLRYTPFLTFAHDETLDRADRLEQVVQAIHAGATEVPDEHVAVHAPVRTHQTGIPNEDMSPDRPTKQGRKPHKKRPKRSRR